MFHLTTTQLAIVIAVSGAAGWLLRKNLWRALVWIFPSSVRVEDDAPASARLRLPQVLDPQAAELAQLGFTFIGTHLEQPRLGAAVLSFDYSSRDAHAFASLFVSEEGDPRLELLTPLAAGGFVRT